MAVHDVTFTVPERPLENKDIEFDIRSNKAMLGTLKVSRGGVVWRPRDYKFGYYLTWEKLNDTLRDHHTSERAM